MMSKCVLCGIDTYWHTQLEEENARLQTELTALTAANDSNYNLLLAAQAESARLQAERDDAIVQHQECQEILIDCQKELDAAKKELVDERCDRNKWQNKAHALNQEMIGKELALKDAREALEKIGHYSFGYEKVDSIAPFKMNMKDIHRFSQESLSKQPNTAKAAAMQEVVEAAKQLVEVEASFKTPMPLLIEKHKKLADAVQALRATEGQAESGGGE